MIDQAHINLLNLIPGQMKKVGGTNGGEYHGPCPFCGGRDRFIVQPNDGNGGHWWCRQCDRKGDALAFIMESEQLDFKAACERLNLILPDQPAQRRAPTPQPPIHAGDLREDYACFHPDWQRAAEDFAYDCAGRLWDGWDTLSAARYLEARGIDRTTAIAKFLGLNADEHRAQWGEVEVWLPRGITIPWQIEGQYWNVRVRRPNADLSNVGDKYISPKGTANGMYNVDLLSPGCLAVLTEGEFDTILLDKCFEACELHNVRVVSVGSCAGARLLRWVTRLALAKRVYIALDGDAAGEQAAGWWLAALPRKALRLKPTQKDITEMWHKGELPAFMNEVA